MQTDERVALLERLALVDGEGLEAFDRLTRLVVRLLGVPVALAVVVERDRQVFVSQIGLPEPWASRGETPLTHSFCQHVVASGEPLIVADARLDERVRDNLAIPEIGVIAYAGIPLRVDGVCVGSLCAIDSSPRAWTDEEVAVVRDLAAAAGTELSLRRALADERAAREELVVAESELSQSADEHEALRRMLENTLARYRTLAGNLPGGGVFLFDADLRYVLAEGPLVRELTGGAKVIGRTPAEVFPVANATQIESWYRETLAGATHSWRRPGAAGKIFDVTITPTRDAHGTITGGMALALDVTDAARAADEQAALQDIAQAVALDSAPEDVLLLVAERVASLFEAVCAGIVRFDPDGRGTILASAPASPESLVAGGRVDLPTAGALGRVAAFGLPNVVRSYPEAVDDALLSSLVALGAVGGAAIPITIHNRTWGALAFGGANGDRLTDEITGHLERFASLVGIAIASAEAWQTLARQATTDHLTGLPNRRVFDERLVSEISRAARHDRTLALVLFDIDHFKQINDRDGHPAGDRVLAQVGAVLLRQTRAGETIARIGGEEFAWILPEAQPADAYTAAERARAAIAALELPGVGGITVSAGIAALEGGDAADLLAGADDALYEAKRAGRNRTVALSQARL
jgi:diguanylate cyclase (GGDEF)-like protein